MGKEQPEGMDFHKKIMEINKKLNNAEDFDEALNIATEELRKALDVERIQIILHRSRQNS